MLQTLVSTENMTRDEWLRWRMSGLGGSDAAVACGLSRYKSPVQLWMEKRGIMEIDEAGEAAYWGNIMEPIIRQEFTWRTGVAVNEHKAILRHKDYSFMLANLDGITEDGYIFEAKTASAYKAGEWEDGIPDEYMLQVQHYLAVTELEGAYVAALIGGNTFRWEFIPRDDVMIKMLITLEQRFWKLVENKTPPEHDGSNASGELVNRLYASSNKGSTVTLPDTSRALIEQYKLSDDAIKEATLLKDEASNKLKALMKDTETASIGDTRISWKPVEVERLNTALLKAEMQDIYSKYTTKSSYRRFSIR